MASSSFDPISAGFIADTSPSAPPTSSNSSTFNPQALGFVSDNQPQQKSVSQELINQLNQEASDPKNFPPSDHSQLATNLILSTLAPESIPLRALSYAALNAPFGAAGNPNSPVTGALTESAIAALGSMVPGIPGLIKSGYGMLKNALAEPEIPPPVTIDQNPGLNSPYKPTNTFGSAEGSQFGTLGQSTPVVPSALDPQQHASNLMSTISKGESPEQAAQTTASIIKNSYNTIKNNAQSDYNNFFPQAKGIRVYQPENPIAGIKPEGSYIDTVGDEKEPFDNENLNALHNSVMQNPSIENAHNLQSGLGEAIGDLKDIGKKQGLNGSQRDQLTFLNNARSGILSDMYSAMDDTNPSLTPAYKQLGENWKANIIPYESDGVLKQISRGDIQNPTTSQLTGIFGNPEPEIQKVAGDLGREGTDRIAYLGMGKLPEENSPNSLIAGNKSLQRKGLGSYLNPDVQQSFNDLGNKIQLQKQIQSPSGIISTANPFSSMQKAQSDSNAILQGGLKKYNDELNPPMAEQTNALRNIAQHAKKYLPHVLAGFVGHIL